jgi:hypothetical protein
MLGCKRPGLRQRTGMSLEQKPEHVGSSLQPAETTRLFCVAAQHARGAGCEWFDVDFEPSLAPFYVEALWLSTTKDRLDSPFVSQQVETQPGAGHSKRSVVVSHS